MKSIASAVALACLIASAGAGADDKGFSKGPLINDFGPVVPIPEASLPSNAKFSIAFDVTARSETGAVNKRIESAARFLNMHVAAGVDPEDIKLAVVIHGSAVFDMTSDDKYGGKNANADLIAQLMKHGVTFHVCGQSAVFQGVSAEDLLPGVKMELSAMTAHALLQQKGYTLNP